MTAAFSSIAALLLSVLMLIGGNSLVGVVTPLRARIEGFPDLTVGLLGSVYFAGMLAGTLAAPAIIRRGGHIRAFAAFVALAVVSVILMPVLRVPMGLARLPRADRLRVCGPLRRDRGLDQRQGDQRQSRRALRPLPDRELRRLGERAIGAEAARSGRLFPLRRRRRAARARDRADGDDQRRSARPAAKRAPPPDLAHAHGADLVFRGAGRGRGERRPVRARTGFRRRDRHGADKRAACSPRSIVLGSALGVLPIAAISDRVDRRLVIAAVTIAGAACEVALSRMTAPGAWLLVLGFLVGLTTYSLYTLAVSLANDDGAPHDLIFISVGLLFIYCVAAIAAPAVASVLMKDFGPQTLFLQNAYVHLGIAALALWGLLARPRRTGTQPA